MATVLHRPRAYTSLDLPHPLRAAAGFGVLAAVALALDLDPQLPWAAGAAAAALFAAAGALRTVHERRELGAVRRSADHLIVNSPRSRDASELVRWRTEQLTARSTRDRLRREVERTLRVIDPDRLPSASPVRRGAARGSEELLHRLSDRLADEQPVTARGILLAQILLRDPASPLYSEGAEGMLPRALRRVIGALDP